VLATAQFGAERSPPAALTWLAAPNQTPAAGETLEQWEFVCTFIGGGRESQPSRPLWCPGSATAGYHHKGIVSKAKPATLSVAASGNVQSVRFYKGKNTVFGLIGEVPARGGGGGAVTFVDEGIEPDFGREPPEALYGVTAAGVFGYSEPFRTAPWTTATAYHVGDLVTQGGSVYRCSVAGISGATGPGGTGSFLVDGATTDLARSPFAPTLNQLVRYRGVTLVCTQAGTTHTDWSQAPYRFGEESTDGTAKFKCIGVGEAVRWDYVGVAPQAGAEPACGVFFDERLAMGGALAAPESIKLSMTADYGRFDYGKTLSADDGIDLTLGSRRRELIRWMAGVEKLIVGTNAGVYAIGGAGGETLTPLSREARLQSEVGCADLHPLVVGDQVLYIRTKGFGVRELSFDLNRGKHVGNDLSIFSSHLFKGHTIVDWAWQEDPWSVVWVVRDDGVFLSLTYQRELGVWAWAWHETDGAVESICTLPEGDEDAVYLIVRRTIGGSPSRFVERLATREVTDARLGCFLDSALSFDGRNTGAAAMTAAGVSYAVGATVTVTASVASFASGDVGDEIVLDPDGETPVRLEVTAFTSATVVSAKVLVAVPAAYQALGTKSWAWARDTFDGMDHLRGEAVAALADGEPVEGLTVEDGTGGTTLGRVVLADPAVIVHIGLPYVSDLEPLDVAGGAEARGREKIVKRVVVELSASRGVQVGTTADTLVQWDPPALPGALPGALFTGTAEVPVDGDWSKHGRCLVRQSKPLPCTVVAVVREVEFAGG
jgi:hypothetical protein